MRSSRWLSLALVLAAASSATACAPALRSTVWEYPDHSRNDAYDWQDASNRAAYRDGLRQGRWDAEHNRSFRPAVSNWRNGDDRRAYYDGYNRAYRDVVSNRDGYRDRDHGGDQDRDHDGYRDRDHDGDHDRGRDYGRDGGNAGGNRGAGYYREQANQTGFQDGLRDGANDKRTGHSFRPTQGDNYKNADRGYLSDMGERDQYKLWYRQGYSGGYKQGWDTSTRR